MPRFLIFIYFVALLSPFIALGIGGLHSSRTLIMEIGRGLGMVGFMILAFQIVLAGRFKALTRPFGLDMVLRYHRHMAVMAFVFLAVHPLFVAVGSGSPELLFSLNLPLPVLVGKGCMILILVNILVSKYQRRLKIKYERWRLVHDILGPVILIGAFLHGLAVGGDFHLWSLRVLWLATLGGFIILWIYLRLVRPKTLWRKPYRVAEVKPETANAWSVKMTPSQGDGVFDYLPGQFHFLTFDSAGGLPREEHHFTISSSPADKNFISSTIKALGDFTSQVGRLGPGDRVRVHGPFGRFSYLLHTEETERVFITGGIGITPLIGMLRHMRDTGSDQPVTLFYANPAESDIVFREELEEMSAGGHPRLKVVHILNHPPKEWTGESGLLTEEMLKKHLTGGLDNKGFYLSGPAGLVHSTADILGRMGVLDRRLHTEIFSFLD